MLAHFHENGATSISRSDAGAKVTAGNTTIIQSSFSSSSCPHRFAPFTQPSPTPVSRPTGITTIIILLASILAALVKGFMVGAGLGQ
ncbi:hypothetical protein [Stieleria mannarensis]|uniref:hypothetical protein n=1 Tax=Stieleria mannarensis TaxID=2755585 RepID=UPI001600BA40|nr:hypothetical protein [Rhodopirellula sp. JC639]